jgi:M6 family metalloprotease-like protein
VKKYHLIALILLIVSNAFIPFLNPRLNGKSFNIHHSGKLEAITPEIPFKLSATMLNVLVVLMDLPDDPHDPSHTRQYYEDLFFSLDDPASVSQYFYNVSYREVLLTGDVLGWFQTENNLNFYGAGTRIPPGQDSNVTDLADEARIRAFASGKDPHNYDLFIVIHSGDGQEYSGNSNDIWSHKFYFQYFDNGWRYLEYTMNHEYVDYETPSHELGHALYFPDLYDLNYEHEFAGPYAMMDNGAGHFSIWNKYYSKISRPDSAQFLTDEYRMQITNYSEDIYVTVNPLAIPEPNGTMWIELGWNSTGYIDSNHGRGWTVTVRENLDYDTFLPKYGVVIAEIQVGRRTNQIQVSPDVYPPWNVIDSHSETSENKDDAAFSLSDGDIGTYVSGKGWAVQILNKYENLSYRIRITNESRIPTVTVISPLSPISDTYSLLVDANSSFSSSISKVEISIDYGSWQSCSFDINTGMYSFNWDTTQEREGTHIIRARAADNDIIPYQGFSDFVIIEVDNIDGSILVVDDDLGRTSESSILNALDDLGLMGDYEIRQTTSFTEAEITSEELSTYEYVLWIGNPDISPLANSHINYNEFMEIRDFLTNSSQNNGSRIVFMSSYNIFDFSNQGVEIENEIDDIFRARSPINFRAPVNLLRGYDFLENIPPFVLGNTDTLRSNRSSDGEVVTLLSGVRPILEDEDPVFPGYGTKGYYVDTGEYKLVNYLFQPEMVPELILPQLINATLHFLDSPNNVTFTSATSTGQPQSLQVDPIFVGGLLVISSIGAAMFIIRYIKRKPPTEKSYWLTKK